MPLLEAEGLARQLEGRLLWSDLGFRLEAGDRLGLVGPSGAGKTLLLRQLAWLDPLQRGRILLAGRSPSSWTLPVYRSRVAYLPQRAVAFAGTVEQNLRQVLSYASHRGQAYDAPRILGWLQQLGRGAGFLALAAERLSGGELQLLALLRALQLDPEILLLDEPTASLDPASTERVEALLHQWLARGQRACLLTSHDGAQIERFTGRRLSLTP
ncbi:MAG: ATP-binding cassette domain-containing protein [Cyanobium sp. CZS 25K]|nr:ATP-binding cassette domain-containing protein [Cyanobium sp. CZS25K]